MDTFRIPPLVTLAVFAVLITAQAKEASADYVVDYYQFEYQPILQTLSIECKILRGEAAHAAAETGRAQLEKDGIFLADQDEETSYTRNYKLGEYNVVVKLDIQPPCHHGYGGENHIAYLSVTINGTEKINIPFGYHAYLNEYDMSCITIHGDGIIYYESQLYLFDYSFFESNEDRQKKLTSEIVRSLMQKWRNAQEARSSENPVENSTAAQVDKKRALEKARKLAKTQDWQAATAVYDQLAKNFPTDAVVIGEYGFAAYKNKNYGLAKQLSANAVGLAKESKIKAAFLYNMGRIEEDLNNPDAAVSHYKESLKLRPNKIVQERLEKLVK